jgi:hypothetical protein
MAVENCLDIDLNTENISRTAGKQAVTKICLNSLWGKI